MSCLLSPLVMRQGPSICACVCTCHPWILCIVYIYAYVVVLWPSACRRVRACACGYAGGRESTGVCLRACACVHALHSQVLSSVAQFYHNCFALGATGHPPFKSFETSRVPLSISLSCLSLCTCVCVCLFVWGLSMWVCWCVY